MSEEALDSVDPVSEPVAEAPVVSEDTGADIGLTGEPIEPATAEPVEPAIESVNLLTADATPEQRAEFYNKIGRPADVSGYKLNEIEFDEGLMLPGEDWQGEISKMFHEAGLNTDQAKSFYKPFMEFLNSSVTEEVKERNEYVYKTLGAKGSDELKQNTAIANRAYSKLFTPEEQQYLGKFGLDKDPVLFAAMNKLGKEMMEASAPNPGTSGSFSMTAEKASSELTELLTSSEYLTNENPAAHKRAVARATELYSMGAKANI